METMPSTDKYMNILYLISQNFKILSDLISNSYLYKYIHI